MNQNKLRHFLKEEFSQAQMRRPGYSLRSFAMRLGVSPSVVSEIFSGKRKVSIKMAQKLLNKLNLAPDEMQKVTSVAGTEYAELKVDHFNMVAEWHHMAILSLLETKGFQNRPNWIANRLGISTQKVEQAMERLFKLEMIKLENGKLVRLEINYKSPDEVSSVAIRKWHRDHLEKAILSLEKDDLVTRDFIGMTIPIHHNDIALIKKRVRSFLEKLSGELDQGLKDEVYQLNFQLLPLSKNKL